MKTIGIIGQGFSGSAMSVICARAKKNNRILYRVIGFEKKNRPVMKYENTFHLPVFVCLYSARTHR